MVRQELIFYGDDSISVKFPDRVRVLYPPEPLTAITDAKKVLEKAIKFPIESDPLEKMVSPKDCVAIAFDDPSLPLPPMKNALRGHAIDIVIEELSRAGVKRDSILLICANGLHRKWSLKELKSILGPRIIRAFAPKRLFCHDAEDAENIISLGKTKRGQEVEINRLAVESDLLVYINITWTSMNGGWKSIAVGLGTYNSIRNHHDPKTLEKSVLMDPNNSLLHKSIEEMGKLIKNAVPIFTIEIVLNNDIWPPYLKFLSANNKKLGEEGKSYIKTKTWSLLPQKLKEKARNFLRSNYGLITVNAGEVEAVHDKTLEELHKQQNIKVKGQTDVLVIGLPNISPYSVFSTFNPVLLMNQALGYAYNLYQKKPLVREGGTLIVSNPCYKNFSKIHHPSYIEFFDKVLPETKDPYEIKKEYEEDFAHRNEYIDKYRNNYAFHGVHPLYAWYWGARALKNLGKVIIAGAKEPWVVRRMGFDNSKSIEEAINKAEELHGKDCTITYQRMPPIFVCEVD